MRPLTARTFLSLTMLILAGSVTSAQAPNPTDKPAVPDPTRVQPPNPADKPVNPTTPPSANPADKPTSTDPNGVQPPNPAGKPTGNDPARTDPIMIQLQLMFNAWDLDGDGKLD